MTRRNPFKVWAYVDNRAEGDKTRGAKKPCVCLHRSNPDNVWEPQSINMTPRQARLAAALLIKAADQAEAGVSDFDKEFV